MMRNSLIMLVLLMANLAHLVADGADMAASDIALPAPSGKGEMSLDEALARRHSVRDFSLDALTLEQAAQLLWAAQGVTHPGHRSAPSAGATYPLVVYLVAGDVKHLDAGIYRYLPERHHLVQVVGGDLRGQLARAASNQNWLRQAPAVIVIAAAFKRTEARYGQRADQYVPMEAGHAAQNILLEATALGLGATPVGAFQDEIVARLLHLPADETPLYLIPVGSPASP